MLRRSGARVVAPEESFFVTRTEPELEPGSRDIYFHIAAELLTGGLLIAGAIATIVAPAERSWTAISMGAFGMLLYPVIQSPGYYSTTSTRRC